MISYKPYLHHSLRYIETINEVFVLLTAYYMPACTEYVPVETRYQVGFVYAYVISAAMIINIIFILYEVYVQLKLAKMKKRIVKRLLEELENVNDKI